MENEFKKVMSERTDEELIQIVTVEREGYEPLAVEAAEAEIANRNIDTSNFEQIKEQVRFEKEQKEKVDSNVVGSGVRFVNLLIDIIAYLILVFVLGLVLTFFIESTDQGILTLIGYVLIFGTYLGYYIFMELMFQKTVGKFITKTKVVKMNGEKPTQGDIVARTFCRFIPFDRLSFLFMKNGFHDSISKTKVVKDH